MFGGEFIAHEALENEEHKLVFIHEDGKTSHTSSQLVRNKSRSDFLCISRCALNNRSRRLSTLLGLLGRSNCTLARGTVAYVSPTILFR